MVVMVDMTIQELMMKGMNHIKEKAPIQGSNILL